MNRHYATVDLDIESLRPEVRSVNDHPFVIILDDTPIRVIASSSSTTTAAVRAFGEALIREANKYDAMALTRGETLS